jgi:dephospho-CoA kinase
MEAAMERADVTIQNDASLETYRAQIRDLLEEAMDE